MSFPLYFDEDSLQQDLVDALRNRRYDVMTANEAGMAGQDDETQLLHASSLGRVIYTFNARDFYQLHGEFLSAGRDHGGIIIGEQQRFKVGEQCRRITALQLRKTPEDMRNKLIFLASVPPS